MERSLVSHYWWPFLIDVQFVEVNGPLMKTGAKILLGIFFALVAAFGVFGYLASEDVAPAHVFWGMVFAIGLIPLAVFWRRGAR